MEEVELKIEPVVKNLQRLNESTQKYETFTI